jgi:hypothetical protein
MEYNVKSKSYCSNCKSFHNAGHPKTSPLSKKYNSWCCRLGRTTSKAIGHCMLKNLKVSKDE